MTIKREDVTLYLFNCHTDDKGINLYKLLPEDNKLNRHDPVKILVHGWMDNYRSYWYKPTVNEYLRKGGVNVFKVNWGKYARNLYYPNVLKAVRPVAHHISEGIMMLFENYEIPFENLHLIGHSLGAHICGFVGKNIISSKHTKIGRITGLDPAFPGFENAAPEDRLYSEDALYVDIIHTDGGGAGFETSLGHIDFFPNGGKKKQNGCSSLDLGCSHKRAPIYFSESINSIDFVAVEAPNFKELENGLCVNNRRAIMGENVDQTMRGNFYLYTNCKTPFAKGSI